MAIFVAAIGFWAKHTRSPGPLARSNYAGAGADVARSVIHSVAPRSRASAHLQQGESPSSHAAARAGPPRPAFPAFFAGAGPGPSLPFLLPLVLRIGRAAGFEAAQLAAASSSSTRADGG
jgi:hypothetical protein